MTDLTAIDVLINPDDAMIARAKSLNARLLTSIPSPAGFALDEHHQPHVTALQRYVRTADLDRVFDAVEEAVNSVDMSTLLTVVPLMHTSAPTPSPTSTQPPSTSLTFSAAGVGVYQLANNPTAAKHLKSWTA